LYRAIAILQSQRKTATLAVFGSVRIVRLQASGVDTVTHLPSAGQTVIISLS
jgi:hypothetical protein